MLRTFKVKISKELKSISKPETVDNEYADFFCKCFMLQKEIQTEYNVKLSIRQMDNLLLEIANKQERKKLNEKKKLDSITLINEIKSVKETLTKP